MINGKLKMKSPERDPSFPLSSLKETYGIKYTSKLQDDEGGKVIGGTRGWDPNCVLIKKKFHHADEGCDEQPAVLQHGEHLVPEHVLDVAVETVSSWWVGGNMSRD